jgi:hypothetical protein
LADTPYLILVRLTNCCPEHKHGRHILKRHNYYFNKLIQLLIFVFIMSSITRPQGCQNHGCSGLQVHPLPFAFSTLWVQCGCRLWVQPVHKTFTTDRIKRRSRMCVGVFHPSFVRNSAKLLSIWQKVKWKALLMEFLMRN